MSKKSDVLAMLEKIPPHEELFLLRAQDTLAPYTVLDWVERARIHGVNPEKIADAKRCALRMREHEGRRKPD